MKSELRIISLCPSNTEILQALSLLKYVVGIDNYSDWPASELHGIPRLGPDLNIDMAKVTSLQPDIVLASLSVPGMERVVEQLDATGIPYLVLSPTSLTDILNDMRRVSNTIQTLTNITLQTEAVLNRLESRIQNVRGATHDIQTRPKVYFEWWPKPVFSPAKYNWLTEISTLAGATNIFGDVDADKVQDDGHRVIDRNPDYFLAVWTGVLQHKVPVDKIMHRPGFARTNAFLNKRLFVLPEGLYCRPSPRLIDGLEQLVSLLHPHIAKALAIGPPEQYGPVRLWNGSWLSNVSGGEK